MELLDDDSFASCKVSCRIVVGTDFSDDVEYRRVGVLKAVRQQLLDLLAYFRDFLHSKHTDLLLAFGG